MLLSIYLGGFLLGLILAGFIVERNGYEYPAPVRALITLFMGIIWPATIFLFIGCCMSSIMEQSRKDQWINKHEKQRNKKED